MSKKIDTTAYQTVSSKKSRKPKPSPIVPDAGSGSGKSSLSPASSSGSSNLKPMPEFVPQKSSSPGSGQSPSNLKPMPEFIPRKIISPSGGPRYQAPVSSPSISSSSPSLMPESIQHKQLRRQQMPAGKDGQPIELVANFFRLITTGLKVHHYHVTVLKQKMDRSNKMEEDEDEDEAMAVDDPMTGDEPTQAVSTAEKPATTRFDSFIKKVMPQVLQEFFAQNGTLFSGNVHYVYDSAAKILYTTQLINLAMGSYVVDLVLNGGRRDRFEVKLQHAAEYNLSEVNAYYGGQAQDISQRAITTYDHILRFVMGQRYVPHQKDFYDMAERENINSRPNLYQLVHGFKASVRPTEFGLALNLHPTSSYVVSNEFATLDQFVAKFFGSSTPLDSLRPDQLKRVNKAVDYLRVRTQHTRAANGAVISRSYPVKQIIPETPDNYFMTRRDGSGAKMRLSDYFLATYGIVLRRLPLVQCGKQDFMPMELCHLEEHQFVSDAVYKSVKDMQVEQLKKNKVPPNEYFAKVASTVEKIAKINPTLLKGFGIELTTKPVKFSGRVLPKPALLNPVKGAFYEAAKVDSIKWEVISFDESCTMVEVDKFVSELLLAAKKKNLNFPVLKNAATGRHDNVRSVVLKSVKQIDAVFEDARDRGLKFVYIIIQRECKLVNSDQIYDRIKLMSERCNIVSQCIEGEKAKTIPRGYFDNMLQKVNAKLDGMNSVVNSAYLTSIPGMPLNIKETMVVGIDVNHPGGTEHLRSSVAAAVGSRDALMAKFSSSVRVQKRDRVEIVQRLDSMINDLLQDYTRFNRDYSKDAKHGTPRYPRNVFVFRDGVSEGQFAHVIEKEIPKIRQAFADVEERGIRLTVVVVQKRHHTRFARTSPITDKRTGRSEYNVPSGTVVDTVIVDPIIEGFLLNSHFSQLGTSKASKYIVLHDDLGLTSDQIERFCYYACHNCVRTENTISHPTPVRYADLCAYRAKAHIKANLSEEVARKMSEAREAELLDQFNTWVKVRDDGRIYLYYC